MSLHESEQRLCCPVCEARYRGTSTCSRCGADLERLMRIVVRAYRLRGAARRALLHGDAQSARKLAAASRSLHGSDHAHRLELLSCFLVDTLRTE